MKKDIFIIILIIILLTVSSVLFIKGEIVLEDASQNYTTFYFEDLRTGISKKDLSKENIEKILSFRIKNNKKEFQNIKITYFIDNQKIVEENIKIQQKTQQIIEPPQEIYNKITTCSDFFIFGIKINEEKDFKLTKKVFLK
jgi:hypothetical protein